MTIRTPIDATRQIESVTRLVGESLADGPRGRVTVDLTISGPDVWTTALTTMAVLRQSGYGMHALHVVAQEANVLSEFAQRLQVAGQQRRH